MVELGFEKGFNSVPLYLDNTSTLHVAGNRTSSGETYCSEVLLRSRTSGGGHDHHPLREHPRSTCRLGTKHLGKHRHLALIKLINDFKA